MSAIHRYVKLTFSFFSALQCFQVSLDWKPDSEGDIFFRKLPQWKYLISCVINLIRIVTIITLIAGLYFRLNFYLENSLYFQLTFHCFWTLIVVACFSFQFLLLFQGQQIIEAVNASIILPSHMGFHLAPKYARNKKLSLQLLTFLCVAYVFQIYVVILPLYLMRYNEKWFLTAYVFQGLYHHDNINVRAGARFIATVYEMWWCSTGFASCVMVIYVQMLYLPTVYTTLKGLSNYAKSVPFRTRPEANSILATFSQLRILSNVYNYSIGQYFNPLLKGLCILIVVSALIVLIKLFNLHDLTLIGVSVFSLGVAFALVICVSVFCGMIHHQSGVLQNELMRWNLRNKFVRRKLRAFRPIGVQVGSFYVIKKGMVLIVLSVISNSAMSLLVSMTFTVNVE
ncbi:unnamed protein product [Orchesella dallaii]|uniref:Gustatory receptor n=1 Tax=Orchesella dallaii TaxID=48710 RepID=A0ABP1RI66_9HEXA